MNILVNPFNAFCVRLIFSFTWEAFKIVLQAFSADTNITNLFRRVVHHQGIIFDIFVTTSPTPTKACRPIVVPQTRLYLAPRLVPCWIRVGPTDPFLQCGTGDYRCWWTALKGRVTFSSLRPHSSTPHIVLDLILISNALIRPDDLLLFDSTSLLGISVFRYMR